MLCASARRWRTSARGRASRRAADRRIALRLCRADPSRRYRSPITPARKYRPDPRSPPRRAPWRRSPPRESDRSPTRSWASASTADASAPVRAPPKNVNPSPTRPSSVPSSSVTKSRVSVRAGKPTTSGLWAGALTIRVVTCVIFIPPGYSPPREKEQYEEDEEDDYAVVACGPLPRATRPGPRGFSAPGQHVRPARLRWATGTGRPPLRQKKTKTIWQSRLRALPRATRPGPRGYSAPGQHVRPARLRSPRRVDGPAAGTSPTAFAGERGSPGTGAPLVARSLDASAARLTARRPPARRCSLMAQGERGSVLVAVARASRPGAHRIAAPVVRSESTQARSGPPARAARVRDGQWLLSAPQLPRRLSRARSPQRMRAGRRAGCGPSTRLGVSGGG